MTDQLAEVVSSETDIKTEKFSLLASKSEAIEKIERLERLAKRLRGNAHVSDMVEMTVHRHLHGRQEV